MSLGNDLTPAVREESILNGGDITPATRLEYFLAKAAGGGGGGGAAFVINRVAGIIGGEATHLDKSYNEIVAAITNGQAIQVIGSTMNGDYPEYKLYSMVGVLQGGAQSFVAIINNVRDPEVEVYLSETADGQLVINEE